MTHQQVFTRPASLEFGGIYLRRINNPNADQMHPVQFIAYSACPAIVIIQDGSGCERCPRDELFIPGDSQAHHHEGNLGASTRI